MRHIVIIGVGNFGHHCARNLQGKAEVTAIDTNRDAIQRIGPFVTRAVVADATQRAVLEELGIQSADAAVVSLGDRMDSSILVTLHLKALGVKEIFVKSLSEEHGHICEIVGATRAIHPEREVAENLAVSVLEASVVDYLRLHQDFGIIEVKAPRDYVGRNLIQLGLRRRHNVTVIAIFGAGGRRFINPYPDVAIEEGDALVILGENKAIMKFQASLADLP